MIFRTLVAPAFAVMSAFQPVSAMQQVPAGFVFINDSKEGDLYFVKKVATQGEITFFQVHIMEPDGNTRLATYLANCETRQMNPGSDPEGWQTPDSKTVGADWLNAACN